VQKIFATICTRRPRKDVRTDRVLFETAYVCGARASEVCGLYVEDLDLRLDEHARVHGKGGLVRTVLLDDRGYVALLSLHSPLTVEIGASLRNVSPSANRDVLLASGSRGDL
jgi:site-specific recombinase XerD